MTALEDTQGIAYRRSATHEQHWHSIHRSRLFVTLPIVLLSVVGMNFVWEVIRANVDRGVAQDWPLRFTLTDLPTTATIGAALGGLMLARAQFARTVRPHFGYSWTEASPESKHPWDLHFYNGGPGHAEITSVEYRFGFTQDSTTSEPQWTSYQALQDAFLARQIGSADVDILWLGRAPLTPQQTARAGFRLGSFTVRALALIELFEVKILAEDSVGDRHQLIIRSSARLPRKATNLIESYRATSR